VFFATPSFGQKATITVTSPNTCVIWDPGLNGQGTATIRWTSKNVSGNVAIDLSRNGGSSWETLFSSTPNDGQEVWTVRGNATPSGLIRVRTITGASASDTSDTVFAIWGPYYKGFYGGYCTEYAARCFDAVAPKPGVDWSGNAGAWYGNAKNWKKTTDPKGAVPGAIAVWSYGDFGHVASFTGYTKDSKGNITSANFSEENWGTIDKNNPVYVKNAISVNFGKVTTAQLPISNMSRNNNAYKFVGFILPQKK
jgi:hypothetical protein